MSSSSPSDLVQRLAYCSTESMIDIKFCRHLYERGPRNLLFIVIRPAQEYFTYMETSPLAMKGCKIQAYAW